MLVDQTERRSCTDSPPDPGECQRGADAMWPHVVRLLNTIMISFQYLLKVNVLPSHFNFCNTNLNYKRNTPFKMPTAPVKMFAVKLFFLNENPT